MNSEWIDGALESAKKVRHFRKGEAIFREGDLPEGVYVVQKGRVIVRPASGDGSHSKLVTRHDGILGLSAIVTKHAHECSATAETACEIGFVDRTDFLRVLEDAPEAWLKVLHLLSSDVNAAYDQLRSLAR